MELRVDNVTVTPLDRDAVRMFRVGRIREVLALESAPVLIEKLPDRGLERAPRAVAISQEDG